MGKVKNISDDDEKGTAKKAEPVIDPKTDPNNAGATASRLLEEADGDFTNKRGVLRAVSMLPEDEKATEKLEGKVKGLPKGEEVLEAKVRGTKDHKFLVVVTQNHRKFVKEL